ncbi:MAG: hypothetical protein J6U02_02730 [Elusimicrobia bacterium]|jgi:hypothetical protein|nr:hypothetical protein [Elusimicrobiota bacterium]
MKKILLLSLFVCLTACFGACTKRDKLTHNTMILQIEPATIFSLGIGDTVELKAIVRNSRMNEVDEPVRWSVSPAELGSFSIVNAKKTVFLAESSGEGVITLSCQGMSVSLDVTVS